MRGWIGCRMLWGLSKREGEDRRSFFFFFFGGGGGVKLCL